MDTDLLHVLCALGIFGIPLGVAWWSAFRGKQPPHRRGDESASSGQRQDQSWEFPLEREL